MSVLRTDKGNVAGSEIDTAAICIGGALAGEDTPEAEAGLQLFAYLALDIHAIAMRGG